MANASVVDLDADLVGSRRKNLNVLEAELLASAPGDSGLASDGLMRVNLLSATVPRKAG